jgi:two-component sensor histidine kinase
VDSRFDPKPSFSDDYLLVRELTHRINNEFASMIGLVSLAAARSTGDEVKSALDGVKALLYNHACVYRSLQMPTYSTVMGVSDYIRVLCQSIKRAKLDDRNIELTLVEHPLQMRSERCWRLGMIISELIANSARHAFDGRSGAIRIELSASGPIARCRVTDNGSSSGAPQSGNGLKIIEELARELDGEIVHHFAVDGATSILIFPTDDDPSAIGP